MQIQEQAWRGEAEEAAWSRSASWIKFAQLSCCHAGQQSICVTKDEKKRFVFALYQEHAEGHWGSSFLEDRVPHRQAWHHLLVAVLPTPFKRSRMRAPLHSSYGLMSLFNFVIVFNSFAFSFSRVSCISAWKGQKHQNDNSYQIIDQTAMQDNDTNRGRVLLISLTASCGLESTLPYRWVLPPSFEPKCTFNVMMVGFCIGIMIQQCNQPSLTLNLDSLKKWHHLNFILFNTKFY